MRIIAFVIDPVPVRSILSHLDLPAQRMLEFDQGGTFDPADPEPIPEFQFDPSLPD
jgi:hypothetical protein